jgi:hypothetical protein
MFFIYRNSILIKQLLPKNLNLNLNMFLLTCYQIVFICLASSAALLFNGDLVILRAVTSINFGKLCVLFSGRSRKNL